MTNPLPSSPLRAGHAFRMACEGLTRKGKGGSARITLRLTGDEHASLMRAAAGMPVSAYVRDRLFGDAAAPRKRHRRMPVKDQGALAQVLGVLGQSHMASNLNQIARHANCGTLAVDEETENEIKMACARIAWIRVKIIEALGLKAGDDQ